MVAIHGRLGLDPHDPATSWEGERYRPFHVSNHEGQAANVRHFLLLGVAAAWFAWRRRLDPAAGAMLAAALGGVLFCAVLKWQPWHARMHLPLFVIAVPALGFACERWRPRLLGPGIVLWLTWNLATPLGHNSLRPLVGPRPVFTTERFDGYFHDWPKLRRPYQLAADLILRGGCRQVGIDSSRFHLEYPLAARLRESDFSIRFRQEGVANESARYAERVPFEAPCAVICLECGDAPAKREAYRGVGPPRRIDNLLVFVREPAGARAP